MSASIFSFVPEARVKDILGNLQVFIGLAIQLIDGSGQLLMSFGQSTPYCSVLKNQVFDRNTCFELHKKSDAMPRLWEKPISLPAMPI